jgi:IS4 transposase
VKQYLNVPTLFGTTENAVYNQLFAAFIAYVLLRWLYDQTKKTDERLSFLHFVRSPFFLWAASSRLEIRDGRCFV